MTGFYQDLRYALRAILHRPGTTALAVITLALGIGSTTAIFSIVDALILKPLPYSDPGRLVILWTADAKRSSREDGASYPAFEDWRQQSQTVEDMACYFLPQLAGLNLTDPESPMHVQGAKVSPNLFPLMGVEPILGRTFTWEEADQREPVVVISEGLWQNRFGRDPTVLDQTLEIDGTPKRILGVMPSRFQFPSQTTQVWEPHTAFPQWPQKKDTRYSNLWSVVGRLKPGVSVEQAQAEMSAIASRLEQQYPDSHKGLGVNVVPLKIQVTGRTVRARLWMLFAAAFILLLVSCANVAHLLLAEGAARSEELAVRAALGADRLRLVRQLFAESLLLSTAASALGVVLAFTALRGLLAFAPAHVERIDEVSLNVGVLGFSLLLAFLTSILFGLPPALKSAGSDPKSSLNGGTRGASQSVGGRNLHGSLAMFEIALAVVLLNGAGLLIRSLNNLNQTDPGFRADGALSMRVAPPRYFTRQDRLNFYRQLIEQTEALPGVVSAGVITRLFSEADPDGLVTAEGQPPQPPGQAIKNSEVSPGLLPTIGVQLLAGRQFTDADNPNAEGTAIINDTMAKRYWSNGAALGGRFKFGGPDSKRDWITVIGIVNDTRRQGLEKEPVAEFFAANAYRAADGMDLIVRTQADPLQLAPGVRAVIHSLEGRAPVYEVSTVEQRLGLFSAPRLLQTWLLGVFAATALALAVIGVYGVQQRSVVKRRLEFGIRMALGARDAEIESLVLKEGFRIAGWGLGLGLVAAVVLGRLIESQLYDVRAADAATIAVVSAVLFTAAGLASYLPVRKILRNSPIVALRRQ